MKEIIAQKEQECFNSYVFVSRYRQLYRPTTKCSSLWLYNALFAKVLCFAQEHDQRIRFRKCSARPDFYELVR